MLRAAGAYDTWHVVDIPSIICPKQLNASTAPGSPNLAAGKPFSCEPGMLYCDQGGVTDGKKSCIDAMNSPVASRYSCASTASVVIDLGSAEAFDEVVLYQDTCDSASFCGHKVEIGSDNITFTTAYETFS